MQSNPIKGMELSTPLVVQSLWGVIFKVHIQSFQIKSCRACILQISCFIAIKIGTPLLLYSSLVLVAKEIVSLNMLYSISHAWTCMHVACVGRHRPLVQRYLLLLAKCLVWVAQPTLILFAQVSATRAASSFEAHWCTMGSQVGVTAVPCYSKLMVHSDDLFLFSFSDSSLSTSPDSTPRVSSIDSPVTIDRKFGRLDCPYRFNGLNFYQKLGVHGSPRPFVHIQL